MQQDLTTGNITGRLLQFALPMMLGNLLQQLYNVADTLIVGRFLGADALAAVGSSYTLMTFLTSVLLGLCMGSGAVFSIQFGRHDTERLKHSVSLSFLLIAAVTFLLNAGALCGLNGIIRLLRVPAQVTGLMKGYLKIIFWGIGATFCYNFFACLLRSIGNSTIPLLFLGGAAILNIALDLLFVLQFHWGVRGAAAATVIAQALSGAGLAVYTLTAFPQLRVSKRHLKWDRVILRDIASLSLLTCVQQSIMNFGILMVQGLVNSFGPVIMAAFAAAVKIDSFAYMPVQDFGNAFSTFIAQNYGAGEKERIRKGIRSAAACSMVFCRGDADYRRRDALSADRSVLLLRHRPFIPTLWFLPSDPKARRFRCVDGDLPRHAGCARLCALRHPINRRDGDLGLRSDRMAARGFSRNLFLSLPFAQGAEKRFPRAVSIESARSNQPTSINSFIAAGILRNFL